MSSTLHSRLVLRSAASARPFPVSPNLACQTATPNNTAVMSKDAPKPAAAAPEQAPGEGLRSLQTSNVFRAVNFELYARPNKYMMAFGAACFAGCVAYMAAMRSLAGDKDKNTYTAMNDEDEFVVRKRKSKWE